MLGQLCARGRTTLIQCMQRSSSGLLLCVTADGNNGLSRKGRRRLRLKKKKTDRQQSGGVWINGIISLVRLSSLLHPLLLGRLSLALFRVAPARTSVHHHSHVISRWLSSVKLLLQAPTAPEQPRRYNHPAHIEILTSATTDEYYGRGGGCDTGWWWFWAQCWQEYKLWTRVAFYNHPGATTHILIPK